MAERALLLGAVAYAAKVVPIWDGFRAWFRRQGLEFDYVLYSNYERQVADLVAGRIDVAWNSPLAWVRAERLARARGATVRAGTMRDSDQDLRTTLLVRADGPVQTLADLRGRVVGTGAVDSPQATLLPLDYLRQQGLVPGSDFTVRRYDIGVGLHGDHVGGERDAALALVAGDVDCACVLDANQLVFTQEGTLPPGSVRVLAQTARYDHCNMTVAATAPADLVARFEALLAGMSYDDPEVRPLLDLEGLKAWRPGRTEGYAPLTAAVDALGFYDAGGVVLAADYRP